MQIREAEEEQNSTEDPHATSSSTTVNRQNLWKKARTTKDGNMDECVKEIVEKMVIPPSVFITLRYVVNVCDVNYVHKLIYLCYLN